MQQRPTFYWCQAGTEPCNLQVADPGLDLFLLRNLPWSPEIVSFPSQPSQDPPDSIYQSHEY